MKSARVPAPLPVHLEKHKRISLMVYFKEFSKLVNLFSKAKQQYIRNQKLFLMRYYLNLIPSLKKI